MFLADLVTFTCPAAPSTLQGRQAQALALTGGAEAASTSLPRYSSEYLCDYLCDYLGNFI